MNMALTTSDRPGTPIYTGPDPLEELVAEFGQYEHHNGARVILTEDTLVFLVAHGGEEIEIGVEIQTVLEAIGRHNAKIGS